MTVSVAKNINVEALESLRINIVLFPNRYEQKVRELEEALGKFQNCLCDDKKIYHIYLSYSPMCGSFVDFKDFNSEFKAIEFSLINTLNGRETKITNRCNDAKCDYCDNRFRN